jgi:hypothetical protein
MDKLSSYKEHPRVWEKDTDSIVIWQKQKQCAT